MDEFNKVSDRIYDSNEETQYKDEGNEPISIAELEKLSETIFDSMKKLEESVVKNNG